MILGRSTKARTVLSNLRSLQHYYLENLIGLTQDDAFEMYHWQRDEGQHGGGERFTASNSRCFNQATLNVSHVHYDNLPDKRLASATALSCIVHPQHPRLPSMHFHISWTEMKSGEASWRLMADLNPAISNKKIETDFEEELKRILGSHYSAAKTKGEAYFYIPVLGRYRGAVHAYLEGYKTADFGADLEFAGAFAKTVIDSYCQIVREGLKRLAPAATTELAQQLAYHSLYAFQVLTLDRGTTAGLLIHDQNDQGILGSLPQRLDKSLLSAWLEAMPEPQDKLLAALLEVLPEDSVCLLDSQTRQALAGVLRQHYQRYPEALMHQAGGLKANATTGLHR